jgi:putative endonuclease
MAASPRNKQAKPKRVAAYRLGHRAEWLAVLALLCKGFWPLALRYGGKGGEIDLIARRGSLIIFVEVKARATYLAGLESVSAEKQRLMARTVQRWLGANPSAMSAALRADLVIVMPWRWPRHVPHAFELAL